MLDALPLLVPVVLLATGQLALWRRVRGPARSVARAWGRRSAATVAALLLVLPLGWRLAKARTLQLLGEVVPRVETEERVVALTFDDGPSPAHTVEVLSLLRREGVRATFFVVGADLARHPETGRRLVEEGHTLGNHSWSHHRMLGDSLATVREELAATDARIRAAGHTGPIPFRAPYGKRLLAVPLQLWREGRTHVTWDVEPDSHPGVAATPEGIVAHVLERVRPGSIVLLHVMGPARETSRRALPGLIAGLRAQGYRLVTVPELLALRDGTGGAQGARSR